MALVKNNLIIFLLFLILESCNFSDQEIIRENLDLKERIENFSSNDTLFIKDLCNNIIDSMYIVTPYLYLDDIISRCGDDFYNTEWCRLQLKSNKKKYWKNISLGDSYYMLVFKNDNHISTYSIIERNKIDFYGLNKFAYHINEANFKISKNNEGWRTAIYFDKK